MEKYLGAGWSKDEVDRMRELGQLCGYVDSVDEAKDRAGLLGCDEFVVYQYDRGTIWWSQGKFVPFNAKVLWKSS